MKGNAVKTAAAAKKAALPQTGAQKSSAAVLGLAIMALAGIISLAGARKHNN